jgi:hypothetical protein
VQKDVVRNRNRIRKLLDFHGIEVPFAGKNEWCVFRPKPATCYD